MTRDRVGIIVAAAVWALAAILLIVANPWPAESATPGKTVVKGAVVRLGPDLHIHKNAKHAPIGIRSVTVKDCDLYVWLSAKPGDKIVTMSADPHASLAPLDVRVGIRGGATRATLRLWRGNERICPKDKALAGTDVWLMFVVRTRG